MLQVAYISYSSDNFDPDGPEGIDRILEVARKHNSENDISGMLLYKGGIFLQLLEGEQKKLEDLYGRIALDLRHEGLKVLVKQETSERVFTDWTMAYKKVDDPDLDLINTILPWKNIIEDTKNRKTVPKDKIMEIFKQFRYQLK